ncbi:MAG: hypothetical protein WCA63_03170, partial [Gallionella sp.]
MLLTKIVMAHFNSLYRNLSQVSDHQLQTLTINLQWSDLLLAGWDFLCVLYPGAIPFEARGAVNAAGNVLACFGRDAAITRICRPVQHDTMNTERCGNMPDTGFHADESTC